MQHPLKCLILTLGFIFPIGLTACGDNAANKATNPIIIGDLSSYAALPSYTNEWRKGWQMALAEINENGGINGRKLKVVSQDNRGNPADAIEVAQHLIYQEKADLLIGCMFGNVCAALQDLANQEKIPAILFANNFTDPATEKNDYAFAATYAYFQGIALGRVAARSGIERWASVAPNYNFGRISTQFFAEEVSDRIDEFSWVSQDWPAVGKLDAGALTTKLSRINPDGLLNVTFGQDLTDLIRQGHARDLFKNMMVYSIETGLPENMDAYAEIIPAGWMVTGYPSDQLVELASHREFVHAYQKRYDGRPGYLTLAGYTTMQYAAAAMAENPDHPERALPGLTIDSPIGPMTMRADDHISTLGIWVGKTGRQQGRAKLTDFTYFPRTKQ